MFTGLIREIAKVDKFTQNLLTIKAEYRPNIGDSVAINGACLTVVSLTPTTFSVELSPESVAHLAMENYKGDVHIEPAMAMGDRLDGHMVQGHVDCIGTVQSIDKSGNSYDITISVPSEFMKFMIPKGSVAVDGVSLTINEVFNESFRLTIIPHTFEETLFKTYKNGSRVNIETDLFARYIYHMFHKGSKPTWEEIDRKMFSY
jgi:riboflavin synthase